MSFDIEDWFQMFYGEKVVSKSSWDSQPTELPKMIESTLEFLDSKNITATFFVVGWLAKKHPNQIKEIKKHGHEVASHGYWHTQIYKQNLREFRADLRRSKAELEDAIGSGVYGYRAPGYSVLRGGYEILEEIRDAGYLYDSSYMYSESGATIIDGLAEITPNSISFAGRRYPVNGGFVFRFLPYLLWKKLIDLQLNDEVRRLAFYTHSWEIYPPINRIELNFVKNFIQYNNIESVHGKINKLVEDFQFTSALKILQDTGKFNQ
jgi:polysaccharide deacetylase family protein (PEP-CTERM system associated)